jgi:preprotein translocase subunit SecG
MLFGFLLTLYTLNCIILVFLILIQQGKGGLGIGSIGGGSQLLFGGSGGQDFFQKATWFLGTIYMLGSLLLSVMRTQEFKTSSYIKQIPAAIHQSAPIQKNTESSNE